MAIDRKIVEDLLRELDCLRDFVAEGALHMVGARESVRRADALYDRTMEVLAGEP